MGIYVIVSDLMEASPTKEDADEAWLVSTTDIQQLKEKCMEVGVDAVITGASDFNINQSRILCKQLGLPMFCTSDFAWDVSTNKRMFKDLCKKVGAPVAEDYILSDDLKRCDLDKIKYPVVVKPVDKSGNRGMSYCTNEQELIEAYKYARSVSDNSTIIVERELHGPEYAVNYLLADGDIRLQFLGSEHNQPGELENLYSVIDSTSDHLKQYLEEINSKVIEVFKEAGCRDGVAWVETILDDDGHFYLLEMGYRLGGEVVNVPYEKVCHFNTIRFLIEIAFGRKHTGAILPPALEQFEEGVAAAYMLFSKKDNEICNIKGLDVIEQYPNVTIDMPKREGGKVRYHATMGVVHIYGKDIDELCDTIQKVNENLTITDKNGDNMFIYFDDYKSLKEEYYRGLKEFE